MLVVFFGLGVAPGSISDRPGMVLEAPKRKFRCFGHTNTHIKPKCSSCNKTIVFPRFLYGFYTSRALCASFKTTRNRSQSLSNRAFCKDCAKNVSWGGFWEGLACFGPSLGRLLFALGRLLASLGSFLGISWALLGRCLGSLPFFILGTVVCKRCLA